MAARSTDLSIRGLQRGANRGGRGAGAADLFPAPAPARHKGERVKVDVDGRSLTLHATKEDAIRAAGYSVAKTSEKSGVTFDPSTFPNYVFDYSKPTGEPVFSVCRWHVETPQGRQKELKADSQGRRRLGSLRPSSERAKALVSSAGASDADPGQLVYITEGERACDAAEGQGLCCRHE
ncbi:MAG UNVERIFIED_CONTAM: hypothetical protein LVR18_22670 [Planctomycetaceae bacterium]|jgi:hypothetical protein